MECNYQLLVIPYLHFQITSWLYHKNLEKFQLYEEFQYIDILLSAHPLSYSTTLHEYHFWA